MTPGRPMPPADRDELQELIIEHAWLLDHGQWHQMADLYLEDGTMNLGGNVLRGRRGLLDWADARAKKTSRHTHHQCTNIRLRGEEDGTASGTVMLVLHVSDGDSSGAPRVEFVGEYRDRYRRNGSGQWRFDKRELVALQPTAP